MLKYKPVLFVLALALILFAGCPQETESSYIVTEDGGQTSYGDFTPTSSTTILGAIINEWRIFALIFLMISVALIAITYPIAHAFNLPGLKAWADVEMSQVFVTVLIVVFVMASLIFVELFTHALVLNTPELSCDSSSNYCPITVANQYLEEYLDKSMAVYGDILETAIEKGKLATMSFVVGTNYLWLGYLSLSMKIWPHYMIEVTTASQQMQFLMGMRDALVFQQFILNHVSGTLAPMALMLGIVFRSFFITRKLGGLLMAFGIGFLLVFPATYALAMYTLHTTLHGSTSTGGDVSTEFCTASCRELPPLAYTISGGGETYQRTGIKELFPQESAESDDEYKVRIDEFISGKNCSIQTIDFMGDPIEIEICDPLEFLESPETSEDIYTCGYYNEICPQACRSLPYPNQDPECAFRRTEYLCREIVPEECFTIRFASFDDPMLGGLEDSDAPSDDICPRKCRPLVGLKKAGCDIGYGFILDDDGMKISEITAQMLTDGYTTVDDDEDYFSPVYLRCNDTWSGWWFADYYCEPNDKAYRALDFLGFEELDEDKMVAWDEGCPNNCRWVTTDGEFGPGCSGCISQANAGDLWDDAYDAADPDDYDLDTQIEKAKESCYMVIPEAVFTDKDCVSCDSLIDPGFASYPPVHQKCANLCGKVKKVAISEDTGALGSATDGFSGPLATKAITKLIIPSIVLPMLNLVITFMFIRTLSPMLGGDVDIPGMGRLIR